MSDLAAALAANRAAVEELIELSLQSAAWNAPRAPGKWSPSQIVEHVARAIEESANLAAGRPTKFPTLPRFLRPVLKRVLFERVLRTRRFPQGRTNKAMNPASGPATPADARVRLEGALSKLEEACRACGDNMIDTTIFGPVPLVDWVRFQELHTRHHCRQMPATIGRHSA